MTGESRVEVYQPDQPERTNWEHLKKGHADGGEEIGTVRSGGRSKTRKKDKVFEGRNELIRRAKAGGRGGLALTGGTSSEEERFFHPRRGEYGKKKLREQL